jgi:GNAT superfamily N-acetyltransferase
MKPMSTRVDGSCSPRDIQFVDCCAEIRPKVFDSWKWLTDKYLHLDDGFSIVALDGEKPVGIISAYPRRLPPPLYDTQEGYIDLIDVLEPYRRRGIARRLVQMCLDRCRKMGLYQVRAWSSDDKTEAVPMWKVFGFCMCPATEYPRGQTVHGYFVAKHLD